MAKKKTVTEEVVEEVVEATPEVKEEKPVEKAPKLKRGKVFNCERLNIRKGPSTDSEVLGVLNVGTIVAIKEDESTDDFYKINEGYVMKKFIKA